MRFEQIKESEFESIVDLLATGFDADVSVLEQNLQMIFESPETWGHIYGLWEDGDLVGTVTYGSCCLLYTSPSPRDS